MNIWRTLGKALLFPPMAVMLLLVPVATVFLVVSMTVLGTESIPAYLSYVLAAYTLTVWCVKIPVIIRLCKAFKNENKYAVRISEDVRLRVNLSLYGSLTWNTAYAVFQLGLGLYHASVWYYSMAGYYILLAFMRFYLVRHTRRYAPGERMRTELVKYRACGWVFLMMNMALTVMIFFAIIVITIYRLLIAMIVMRNIRTLFYG